MAYLFSFGGSRYLLQSISLNKSNIRLKRCCKLFTYFSTLSSLNPNDLVLKNVRSIPLYKEVSKHQNFMLSRSLWKRSNFGKYSLISKPDEVTNSQPVPRHIIRPPYADTGEPLPAPLQPDIKSEFDIEDIREASQIARSVLCELSQYMKVGVTAEEIDQVVSNKAFEYSSYPSPLNYRGFPKSCCTSVNNVACHGIPDSRALQDGDIISVDVTVFYKGFHGDCCETYLVGDVDDPGKHLVEATRKSRDSAIAICGPGVPFSHIGTVVERVAEEEGLSVVPAFIGHGIGSYFHGPPDIYHCLNNYPGLMKPGMTFTVEPVLAQGSGEVVILEDGWTALTLDNGRAAQFEHTVLITQDGHEILTQ